MGNNQMDVKVEDMSVETERSSALSGTRVQQKGAGDRRWSMEASLHASVVSSSKATTTSVVTAVTPNGHPPTTVEELAAENAYLRSELHALQKADRVYTSDEEVHFSKETLLQILNAQRQEMHYKEWYWEQQKKAT
jgi:hypothetical protein